MNSNSSSKLIDCGFNRLNSDFRKIFSMKLIKIAEHPTVIKITKIANSQLGIDIMLSHYDIDSKYRCVCRQNNYEAVFKGESFAAVLSNSIGLKTKGL